MIKSIGISTISAYQIFVSPMIKNLLGVSSVCRFEETCSNYTKRMINERGLIKGAGLGFIRILKCQPLTG